ncbi:MAG: protein kinase [Candidatus Melainabacteria bacterium]|nr:protein kinase [Candidatus Melainabacteria bacterium]
MSNADDLLNEFTGSDPSQQSDFIRRYEVLETLGQGGMGIVLKARNRALKKLVAIKVLHAAMIGDATNGKRFEIEAQAGSKLSHPNLVSVFDYGYIKADTPFLVMEYIEGISLDKLLEEQRGRLPLTQLLDIFKQVNKGLSYIHNNGIIHRDLKNSNIMIQMIEGEQYAKLLDFGIAKILADGEIDPQHLTKTGSVFGSPPYMSPEQCRGIKTDARSDIYSIGCCMYECVAGSPPLLGDNALQTLFKHANERPEPLSHGNSEIESKLAEIIHKCLELSPDDRFQTASELLAALNALTQSPSQPHMPMLQSAEKADLDALRNRVIEQKVTREGPIPSQKEFGKIADSTMPLIANTPRDTRTKPASSAQLTTGRFKTEADEAVKIPTPSLFNAKTKTAIAVSACAVLLLSGGYFAFDYFQKSSKQSEIDRTLAEADSTFRLGESHFKQARASLKKALKLDPTNDELAGQVYSRQGRMLLQENKLNGAFDDFTEAKRRLAKTKDQHQELYLDALVGLGEIRWKQKSHSQAEDQFIEARKLAQEWNRDPVETGNIFALSALNARYNNREQSVFLYDQALDEYQKAKSKPADRIANAYIESAQVKKKMGANKDARGRLKEAQNQCDKIDDQSLKSETQRRISELVATIPATDSIGRHPDPGEVSNATVTQAQLNNAPVQNSATTQEPAAAEPSSGGNNDTVGATTSATPEKSLTLQKQLAENAKMREDIEAIKEATVMKQQWNSLAKSSFQDVSQQLNTLKDVRSMPTNSQTSSSFSSTTDQLRSVNQYRSPSRSSSTKWGKNQWGGNQ